jgi:hypothetical protein
VLGAGDVEYPVRWASCLKVDQLSPDDSAETETKSALPDKAKATTTMTKSKALRSFFILPIPPH